MNRHLSLYKRFLGASLMMMCGINLNISAQDYNVKYDTDAVIENRTEGTINKIAMKGVSTPKSTLTLSEEDLTHAFVNKISNELRVFIGDTITTTLSYSAETSLVPYLYVDFNQDGRFSTLIRTEKVKIGERLAGTEFVVFNDITPGVYRGRVKLDKAGNTSAEQLSATLMDGDQPTDGVIIDFLLNVCKPNTTIDVDCMHGYITHKDGTILPRYITPFSGSWFKTSPICSGYTIDSITVRHGHNLYGPQYVKGNRQWNEYKVHPSRQLFYLPGDSVNGDVLMTGQYAKTSDAKWIIEFQDEFNQEDGSQPDTLYWSRCPKTNAVWARYMSDTTDVVTIKEGKLICRTIPNYDKTYDDRTMLSGGIQTKDKYWFQYGKVECRALTNPWTGNFPAIWMMPQDTSRGGWPYSGEIDIFETIDSENRAWHTVHSEWTYVLGNTGNPQSTKNVECEQGVFHIFGLEWDAEKIKWYVDGELAFTYKKSTDEEMLSQGQWPFDRTFYLILNQSVGSGVWAKNRDADHTYEAMFDWIRIYKLAQESDIETNTVNTSNNVNGCYNLSGQKVSNDYKGVVICNGKKYLK